MYSDIAQQYLQGQQPAQQPAPTAQINPVQPMPEQVAPVAQAPVTADVQAPQQKPEESGGLGGIVGMLASFF